ncbi:MAG: gliding motility-associated C-terminal domain-containing protein [Bacteroidia bacterium]|nr:gliding motility-associated C-terminal domain-containing protein [Bacteroidia bacterium]
MGRICTIFLLFTLTCLAGFAQPFNDNCVNAINFGTLSTGNQACLNGDNMSATPAFPYPAQTNCQPSSGNLANPAGDVWYTFTASDNELVVNFTSNLASANIALYTGACGSLIGTGCAVSANGNINALFAPISPGFTYYIQVSGGSVADSGSFQLCITNNNNANYCVVAQSMTANPPPVGGVYGPGVTVNFCFTVTDYTQQSANWFHGLVPTFGAGWDLSTLSVVPAASCDQSGNWAWYTSCTSTATSLVVGPGFFYDRTPLDGIPGNNYGDNCTSFSWVFCWTVTTDTCLPGSPGADLTISVDNYADGESGSWSSLACTGDPPYIFNAYLSCCPVSQAAAVDVSCPNSCDGYAYAIPAGNPPFTYSWSNGGTTDTIFGLCPGQYNVTVMDSDSCSTTITVLVNSAPPLVLVTDSLDAFCGNSDGAAWVTVSGGTGPYTYNWQPGGQITDTLHNVLAGTYTVYVTDSAGCMDSATVIVNTQGGITASITGTTPVTCFGGNNGTATATGIGGLSYTFLWLGSGQTTATATGLAAGSYDVEVTDAGGCKDTATAVVTQPTQVTASASSTNVSCFNGSNGTATATGGGGVGGYTYFWPVPGGQTTQSIANLPIGTYNVVITDANGCSANASTTITQPTQLNTTISGVNITCNGGSNGSATVVASGGTGPYAYNWFPSGGNAATANGLPIGTYICFVTDALGCQDSASITLTQPAPLQLTTQTSAATCKGWSDGTATVVAAGGLPPYSYTWTSGALTNVATLLATGNYSVTVTDANGCVANTSVFVPDGGQPSVTIYGAPFEFCEGEGGDSLFASAAGGTSPYFYTWSCKPGLGNCGLSQINNYATTANPTSTNWYYVQAVDVTGCPSPLDSVLMVVLPKPIVNAGPDKAICSDNAPCTILNASVTGAPGPYSYQWYPSVGLSSDTVQNPCARPDSTTIYTLVVMSQTNGCSSGLTTVDSTSSMVLTVHPLPIADAGPDLQHICLHDSVLLPGIGHNAGPNYSYQWSPSTGLSNPSITNPWAFPSATTTYTFNVWSNGCPGYADTVTVVVHTRPTADAGPDVEVCYGEIGQLDGEASGDIFSGSYSYIWLPGSGIYSSQTDEDPYVNPAQTTTFYLIAYSNYGCGSSVDSTVLWVKPTPTAEAGADQILCEGQSLVLPGSIYYNTLDQVDDPSQIYYSWSPNDSLSNVHVLQPTADPTVTTMYYLTVNYNTCETMDSVLVTVVPEIGARVAIDTSRVCGGDTVHLFSWGGSGAQTYDWSPSAWVHSSHEQNPYATPDSNTVFQLIITEGPCKDTASVGIDVIPTPEAAYTNSFTEGCIPFMVSVMDISDHTIFRTWDWGDGTPVSNQQNPAHTYTEPGTYVITLTPSNIGNCTSSTELEIHVYDTASADFSSNPQYPTEFTLPGPAITFFDQSENAISWLWDFGDGKIAAGENVEHVFEFPGEYYVKLQISTEQGCEAEVTHGPYLITDPTLFIPNVFTPNGDGFQDEFRVNYSGDQPFVMSIRDRWGVEHFATRNKNEGWNGISASPGLAGQKVAEGVYFYYIKTGDREYTGNLTLVR